MNLTKVYEDQDLTYYEGFAVQKDKTQSVEYGEKYFDKYVNYEGSPTSLFLNKHRVAITEKHCKNAILDIGIGSGEFIKSSKLKVYGFDINPFGVKWLKFRKIYIDPYKYLLPDIAGWTFWDSLEHFPDPQIILQRIPEKHHVFISIPIFPDILKIKKSKHYRPNEHYYYFTSWGLIWYMKQSGFIFLEHTDAEIKAGRQSIFTFVFQRRS